MSDDPRFAAAAAWSGESGESESSDTETSGSELSRDGSSSSSALETNPPPVSVPESSRKKSERVRNEKKMLKRDAEKFARKSEKRGLVYLSRVPPFMKVQRLRSLLSQFGLIGRIWLAPETEEARTLRKKRGGNRKVKFTEGWVEFEDKKIAKSVADSLNNTSIGGKKGGYYHDDIWNIKYLPKFKWSHLTESVAYERAIQRQRLRQELSHAKHEADDYRQKVEQAKQQKQVSERRAQRAEKRTAALAGGDGGRSPSGAIMSSNTTAAAEGADRPRKRTKT